LRERDQGKRERKGKAEQIDTLTQLFLSLEAKRGQERERGGGGKRELTTSLPSTI